DIEFRSVDFAYPSRPKHQVFSKFDLVIPKGKVIALCGSSGGGKSTVGALIERFYDPTAGEILVDGRDIRVYDPRWLRRHIGYINQEPSLFAMSILDNIRFGNPEATPEQVVEAARKANAHEFIMSLPEKYDTILGERGVTLSGAADSHSSRASKRPEGEVPDR
ncbi:MAG: ATP-binding cassette, sub-family B, member 1, partial [Olpidium bornovanus]